MSLREEISQDRERGGKKRGGERARQAKGFSGTNVKTNDSGCKARSRGKVYGGREGGRARGYKGGCNHPDDDNFFLFSFHPKGERALHFYLFPLLLLFSSLLLDLGSSFLWISPVFSSLLASWI